MQYTTSKPSAAVSFPSGCFNWFCFVAGVVLRGFRMEPLGVVQFQFLRIPMWTLPFAQMGGETNEVQGRIVPFLRLVVVTVCSLGSSRIRYEYAQARALPVASRIATAKYGCKDMMM